MFLFEDRIRVSYHYFSGSLSVWYRKQYVVCSSLEDYCKSLGVVEERVESVYQRMSWPTFNYVDHDEDSTD